MNEPNQQGRDKLLAIVTQHVNQLEEHFDNVQIFVSNLEQSSADTAHISKGGGNWHARYGQVREWLTYQDAQTSAKATRDFRRDNPTDDGESGECGTWEESGK